MQVRDFGHAFGIEVIGSTCLEGMIGGRGPDASQRTALTVVDREAIEADWPVDDVTRLVERRLADGSVFMSVDHHPLMGYMIQAREHGIHRVGVDAATWAAWLPAGPTWRWQKLVFAQVLPVIATLHGIAAFHASGVAIDGRAFGLLAPSGTGKSSVASQLVATCGATFFTDDVLALEVADVRVIAHPGPQFTNVHAHELATLTSTERALVGAPLGESDKHHLRAHGIERPLPLGGLFLLNRHRKAGGIEAERTRDAARHLLGGAFVPHMTTTRRLLAQLDVCAAIAAGVPVHRVGIGTDVSARDVAQAVAALARAR